MDVIELLKQDHAEVNELFRRYQLASRTETTDDLVRQVVRELSVHAAIEEQFVYPLLRFRVADGRAMADESIAEHHEVKELLSRIEGSAPGSSARADLMAELIEAVRAHVEDEEGEVFPRLRENTDETLRRSLGKLARAAKYAVPTHPHPLVPGTATAQLLAGPWLTLVDKARDLVATR